MHPHIQTLGSILRLYSSKTNEALLGVNSAPSSTTTTTNKIDETGKDTNQESSGGLTKARPNKELLEMLKEEMRKLKPNINQPQTSDSFTKSQSILTIPPLFIGDNEFKLSSNIFLMLDEEHEVK